MITVMVLGSILVFFSIFAIYHESSLSEFMIFIGLFLALAGLRALIRG